MWKPCGSGRKRRRKKRLAGGIPNSYGVVGVGV